MWRLGPGRPQVQEYEHIRLLSSISLAEMARFCLVQLLEFWNFSNLPILRDLEIWKNFFGYLIVMVLRKRTLQSQDNWMAACWEKWILAHSPTTNGRNPRVRQKRVLELHQFNGIFACDRIRLLLVSHRIGTGTKFDEEETRANATLYYG